MKQIAKINRSTEGKSWHIIGAVGSYLKIQTHNSNGSTFIRIIAIDDYRRDDRYISRIPVYRYSEVVE